ncbi:hypothetical protein FG386_003558 [Cryptosporidium ryanae]|uniref:uncharacterized protein n=1 Tax=Cryptosporidium ryanae TaxID=515981 RepID=UPI00351AA5AC|nr:hypothetical protein FG386_003558 [Cryptosporidium ryanae]
MSELEIQNKEDTVKEVEVESCNADESIEPENTNNISVDNNAAIELLNVNLQDMFANSFIGANVVNATRMQETIGESWPFDQYQATGLLPVDYAYWLTPYNTSIGPTAFVMMQSTATFPDGTQMDAQQARARRRRHVFGVCC